MTKQRIILTARQVREDKARAVRRAKNGEIEACLTIIRKHLSKYLNISASRYVIPAGLIGELKDEIKRRRIG